MPTPDKSTPQPNSPVNNRASRSFPTPVIDDGIIEEYISTEPGSYIPLAYGTLWDDVKHTAFQVARPGFQLVWQGPVDTNAWLVKRIWANDRVDQDAYNYSISYISENPDYPDITRIYVYPRDRYNTGAGDELGPLAPLTQDSEFPSALLTSEQMINEVQPAELTSKYVKVVRRFQVIPGPITLTQDFDTELNTLVYTSRQLVLASTTFNPSAFPLTLEMRETSQSQYVKLRIISYLTELPAEKVEYQTGRYPFPALVSDIGLSVVELTTDPQRSEVIWFPVMRSEPNVPAIFKVTTSFATTSPTPVTLYAINAQNLIYRGISFQVAINQVLNDAISVTASFTDDARYGDLSETKAWSATTPSAAEYTADIGEYKDVGCDITRWRGQIWVEVVQAVLLV